MGTLRLVVFGDSVSVNYARASTETLGGAWPAPEVEAQAYPEIAAETLGRELGRPVELIRLARLRQTIKVSQRMLATAVAKDPGVVIIAHGGHEGLLLPPRRLDSLQAGPPPTSISETEPLAGNSGVQHQLRRWTRHRIDVCMHSFPRQTARALRAVGFHPVIPAAEYETRLRDLVGGLLAETQSLLVLVGICGTNAGTQHILDPAETALNDAAAERLARENPGRVLFCPRPAAMSDPASYLPDGSHLSGQGHAVMAEALVAQLRTALITTPHA